jgi:hypothetical protein
MRRTASTPSAGIAIGAATAASLPDADPAGSPLFFDPHAATHIAIPTTHRFPIMARRIHLLMPRTIDPLGDPHDGQARARSACVVVGAAPDQLAPLVRGEPNVDVTVRANRLGALAFGRLRGLPIELADAFDGPVYDILYNPTTGWFSVTVFRGVTESPVRYDNRPDDDAGYPRVQEILGATAPADILAALDVPPDVIGYVTS